MRPGWPILVFVAVMATGALAQTPPPARLPLDPLTPAEQERAQTIALSDERVRSIAGPNIRVIVTLFIAPKRGTQSEPEGRHAEVIVRNESEGGGAQVLVSLSGASVVDVVRLTERNVPIGPSDIELAAALALEQESVQRLLGGAEAASTFRVALRAATRETRNENRIEGVPARSPDPEDPCSIHRCVALFFRSQGRYIAMNQVTVDLTARRVYVREGGLR